ncbi:MAG: hypothetical protein H0V69_08695 [Acidimicrobiia bacterium]|nr:hypothetical protein [Acidimicrobiia bacterium]
MDNLSREPSHDYMLTQEYNSRLFGADVTTPLQNTGGQGRLATLLEARGGSAAPEAPFVIEHREALVFMLCEAAELEHDHPGRTRLSVRRAELRRGRRRSTRTGELRR